MEETMTKSEEEKRPHRKVGPLPHITFESLVGEKDSIVSPPDPWSTDELVGTELDAWSN